MEKNQKICVSAIIPNEGKILVLKRSQKETFLPGYYDLPGGKINFGEGPEEGLKREVKEEANLDVEVERPYALFSYVSDGGNRQTVDIQFITKLTGPLSDLALSEAHESYCWMTEDEVRDYLMTDETRGALLKGFEEINKQ